MAEIEFTIDPATGQLDVHVKGIRGPACQDVAKLVEDLLGKPAIEQNTADFYLKRRVQPQIQPKRSK